MTLDTLSGISGSRDVDAYMAKGPLSRLVYGDMTLVADLRQCGMTSEIPLAFRSEKDLVEHLNDWMLTHPSTNPPGSIPLQKQHVKYQHVFDKPIYFAATSQKVEIIRFQISDRLMGFTLKDNDGSCMYVIAAAGNSGAARAYHGWLGKDRGFAAETIAASRKSVKQITSEGIKVHFADTTPDPSSKACSPAVQAKTHHSCSYSNPEVVIPLASQGAIKDRARNSRYSSLSFKGHPRGQKRRSASSPQTEHGRLPSSGFSISQISKHKRTESVVRQPTANRLPRQPSGTVRHQRRAVTPPSAYKAHPLTPPPTPGRTDDVQISFYFFTSDQSLGAIPAGLASCSTVESFFNQAMQALSLTRAVHEVEVIGVNVIVDALDWPLILPWGNDNSYKEMMQNLHSLAIRTEKPVTVKVNCLVKK